MCEIAVQPNKCSLEYVEKQTEEILNGSMKSN